MSTLPSAVKMHTDFPCHLRSVQAFTASAQGWTDGRRWRRTTRRRDDALDDAVFTWKALGTVVGSVRVNVLFGVGGDFRTCQQSSPSVRRSPLSARSSSTADPTLRVKP